MRLKNVFSSRLPGLFLCSSEVPGSAYSSLSENDTILILNKLKKFCNGTDNAKVPASIISKQKQSSNLTFLTFSLLWIKHKNKEMHSLQKCYLRFLDMVEKNDYHI